MEKKYWIYPTDKKSDTGNPFYQIEALKNFICQGREVKKGERGGYIEKFSNLSQEGSCWIFDSAVVYGEASVKNDAKIENFAVVKNNALVADSANIRDEATVCNNAVIKRNGVVEGKATVGKEALVNENAVIGGTAVIRESVVAGDAHIYGRVFVNNSSCIDGKSIINGCGIGKDLMCELLIGEYSLISDSILIGNLIVKKSRIGKAFIKGALDINKSIIMNVEIGKKENIWEEETSVEIFNARIVSENKILIVPIDFIFNKDREQSRIAFVWYQSKITRQYNFSIQTNKKKLVQNSFKGLLEEIEFDSVTDEKYLDVIKKPETIMALKTIKMFMFDENKMYNDILQNLVNIAFNEKKQEEKINIDKSEEQKIKLKLVNDEKILSQIFSCFLWIPIYLCKYSFYYNYEIEEMLKEINYIVENAKIDIIENKISSINSISEKKDKIIVEEIKTKIADCLSKSVNILESFGK